MYSQNHRVPTVVAELIRFAVIIILTTVIAFFVSTTAVQRTQTQENSAVWNDLSEKIANIEKAQLASAPLYPALQGKTIIYDGDSIAESRQNNGGGYPSLIADITGGTYKNFAVGGARLCSYAGKHSVVDNLKNLPADGDLYCFEGGINDFWGNTPLGICTPGDYSGPLDTRTICGAMEAIFRHCMTNYPGKPVCFVIVHKVQQTAYKPNANGDTSADYRNAMIQVCQKYSVPYYDAFGESGLNGWDTKQSELFLTANDTAIGDGIHPNVEGYKRYYIPQLLSLFEQIMPVD